MVRLLGVADQVVLAAKLLWTELALEVALARVHHQVTFDVLAREEGALAAVALEASLGGRLDEPRRGTRVHLEVQQDVLAARERGATQPADGVARLGRVQRRVLAERERRAVLLAAQRARVQRLVGVVHLLVRLEVVLAVEAALARRALEGPLAAVDQRVPQQLELRAEEASTAHSRAAILAATRRPALVPHAIGSCQAWSHCP